MKILAIGSRYWESYPDLMRYMAILIQDAVEAHPDDKTMTFVHSGSIGAENMVTEYVGKVHKLLKSNGYKIKEELIRDRSEGIEESLILSDIDFALVFGKSYRTNKCVAYLELYGIPYRFIA